MQGHGIGVGHQHNDGPLGWILRVFHLHGHEHGHGDAAWDNARSTQEGIRTVWIALGALAVTAVIQIVIFAMSGSVSLLADTVHNFGDMLNSIPLLLAFYLARLSPTRRYTYGYGRAEDVAGIVIVLYFVQCRLYPLGIVHEAPRPATADEPPWVAVAAVVGFSATRPSRSTRSRLAVASVRRHSLLMASTHESMESPPWWC